MKTWLAGILLALATWLVPTPAPKEKPLEKYTIEALREREYKPSDIVFTQKQFFYYSDGKKVTGTASSSDLTKPTIILIRGFASQEEYYPGFGTERLAALLAKNGFTTLAPDFLGYGSSASHSADIFEERFETYTTVLNLMASVPNLVGLWGHSNGGQIALTALEISGNPLPTVLWNPVSKPFPYSILYYTDEFEDKGRTLRKALADFEANYDVEQFNPINYLNLIKAPVLLQQGELDDLVPKKWSDDLTKKLDTGYKLYAGSDHNMLPRWEEAASDAVKFFKANQ